MDIFATYTKAKNEAPDHIILIKCGDFYEAVADDAVAVAGILGTVLQSCPDGAPLTGFPAYRLEDVLQALDEAGHSRISYAKCQ